MSDVKPLAAEELADFMRDPGDAWENTKRHTNEWLGSIRATIVERDERIREMESEDGIVDKSLNRLADRLVAAEAENARQRSVLKQINEMCGRDESTYGPLIDEIMGLSKAALQPAGEK